LYLLINLILCAACPFVGNPEGTNVHGQLINYKNNNSLLKIFSISNCKDKYIHITNNKLSALSQLEKMQILLPGQRKTYCKISLNSTVTVYYKSIMLELRFIQHDPYFPSTLDFILLVYFFLVRSADYGNEIWYRLDL